MDGAQTLATDPSHDLRSGTLQGLRSSPKYLSPKWLYDARGSELFEQITTLPEYYLTRTEAGILRDQADSLARLVPNGGALVELGSGASVKTRTLLDAGAHFGAYVPIDISAAFLQATADDLQMRYPSIDVMPVVGDFTGPVDLPSAIDDLPKIGFFPGSTIGNLEPAVATVLLRNARQWHNVEGFILGADFVKDPNVLVEAYDDRQGVTAAFISNILVRLNRDLGANFDLGAFRYVAQWNETAARIDMFLMSTRQQNVDVAGEVMSFAADELIHISASRKYTPDSLAALAQSAGWKVSKTLTDPDHKFGVFVLTPN